MNTRNLLLAAGLTAALALSGTGPAAAADELIASDPASVTVEVPAPGHSDEWQMSVDNLTAQTLPLTLEVDGLDGALLEGPTPLHVEVADAAGRVVFDSAEAGADEPITLPQLDADGEYTLHGTVSLPREADNRYQGLSSHVTFAFATMADDAAGASGASGDGILAHTGLEALPFVLLAIALAVIGVAILIRTRRKGETS